MTRTDRGKVDIPVEDGFGPEGGPAYAAGQRLACCGVVYSAGGVQGNSLDRVHVDVWLSVGDVDGPCAWG
jgi:hypothetical protein